MKVFRSMNEVGDSLRGCSVAIGNFDGVHRGHQALIKKARDVAPFGTHHGVLTFSPHPLRILRPDTPHFMLMTDEQKLKACERLGVDFVVVQQVDHAFLQVAPKDFVRDSLVTGLGAQHVVVGDDFAFGNEARGTVADLDELGTRYGFTTHVVAAVMHEGERCSSTAIRNYLRAGNVARARDLLSRPFSVVGEVVHGQKQGAQLGYRTANVEPPSSSFALAHCIYATIARINGKDYLSATNVGTRPTITTDKKVVVEAHLFDVELDLYGQDIEIFFIAMMRPEQKFTSLNELITRIAEDCEDIRALARKDTARFQIED